ncbi:MAG: GNAT family N-acetyltransferase [Candidatus Poribacteria bacterium]|nr:GNAT family N-acetyltransferase [Candidatus Poribacteria bacterium]
MTLQSFEDAFNKPFYMERGAAIYGWKAYIRREHHPRDAKDPRIVYVSIINGEIVGFIAGDLTERFGLDGELQSIYALPKHQGRELGTQLVIVLAKWFKKWDAKEVCVDHKDSSEGFYIKLGAKFNNHGWVVNFTNSEKGKIENGKSNFYSKYLARG